MDDRDFEARLSARLHRRFDGLHPSPELRAGVDQVLSTRPEPIGLAVLRGRRRELGWGALVAAGLIVALALSNGSLGGPFRPGAPSASPGPSGAASTLRDFIVLPPAGHEPNKEVDGLASEVLNDRLRTLFLITDGGLSFTSGSGYAETFQVPREGPSDASIRSVLRAAGDVAFMSLPTNGTGGATEAVVGQNPPDGAQKLFGWEGIGSTAMDTDQQDRPALSIALRPAAAEAFAAFTSDHVGETFAIVIDDDVALLPTIAAAITDGKLLVSAGADFAESAAIIDGGKLPDAWIIPTVPELISPSDIAATMELEFSKEPVPVITDLTVTDTSLTAIHVGRRVVAVWYLTIEGLAEACPSPLPSDERGTCRYTDPDTVHVFDAETGEWLGTADDFDEST